MSLKLLKKIIIIYCYKLKKLKVYCNNKLLFIKSKTLFKSHLRETSKRIKVTLALFVWILQSSLVLLILIALILIIIKYSKVH